MRSGSRFHRSFAAALAFAALASLALSGCEDVLNSLLDNAAPTGVDASDGDYPNSISVSWSAPSLSSDTWKGYTIDHYDVSWSWASGTGYDYDVSSTSTTINGVSEAVEYDITVTAILRSPGGGTETGGSASDTGFAMDASPLVWYDGGANYAAGSGDSWYVTMLQEGFAYRFAFIGTGSAEFYPYESLDSLAGTETSSSVSWTCDSKGKHHKFYVKITQSGSDPFFAKCSYGY
jgi:hypothetical protein